VRRARRRRGGEGGVRMGRRNLTKEEKLGRTEGAGMWGHTGRRRET
jgi:hypothetical protein